MSRPPHLLPIGALDTHLSQRSDNIDARAAATIKLLLALGHQHKRIAALFDCNQGRISEIATGRRFADVPILTGHVIEIITRTDVVGPVPKGPLPGPRT